MPSEQQFADIAHAVAPMLHRTALLLTSDRHDWIPKCVGGKLGVWALALTDTHLHLGGRFSGFDTISQRGYARFSQR